MALQICFDSNLMTEIIGNSLIDRLEKTRLIDDLWALNHQQIDSMPKTKILKKEG